jgi:proprotein convertase subtilisin/kexin type 5
VPCDLALCRTCNGVENVCASCDAPKFLHLQGCITPCPSGTYGETNNRACVACTTINSQCLTCTSSGCTKCSSGYYLQSDGSCQTSCVAPLPVRGDGVCLPCPTDCQTCDQLGSCSQCTALSLKSVKAGACVASCLPQISVNGICTACTSPCLICINIVTRCTSCITDYKLQSETCVADCGGGLVLSLDGLRCVPCGSNCLTCQTRENVCTSCATPMFLQATLCVSTCSSGIGVSGVCMNCPAGCLSCNSQLVCLVCGSDFLLAAGACAQSCPASAPIPSGRLCLPCTLPCTSCNASSYCFACSTPSLAHQGQCLAQCPSLYESRDNSTCTLKSSVTNLTNSNNSTGVLPVPCTISGVLLAVIVGLSKFSVGDTKVMTGLAAALAVPEAVSWFVLVAMQAETGSSLAGLTAAGIALLVVANIVSLCLFAKYVIPDKLF